ncbi:hypothetical protein AC578_3363 [Pseudocercospora eumusae]|uniref:Uncharacterized protein n=1 Tax=Pseudocercospora eumusae TaxID=321146 RepID=A0A139HD75_9PEZI|nr:hypothetical protein AC578_3363 [Pseudocercospora eumusae]
MPVLTATPSTPQSKLTALPMSSLSLTIDACTRDSRWQATSMLMISYRNSTARQPLEMPSHPETGPQANGANLNRTVIQQSY